MLPVVLLWATILAGALAASPAELGPHYAAAAEVGHELIGTVPPEWTFSDWQNSAPLHLSGLCGKVVLVRWWTGPGCPYCAASADALSEFARTYADRGLVVIGAYHHKGASSMTLEQVQSQAKRLGFTFPIAIDRDWRTLHRWWLDSAQRDWTSVTFLIGKDGAIRHIHGGGAFYAGEPGYVALDSAIRRALQEAP